MRGQCFKKALSVLTAVVGNEAREESKEAMCCYQDNRFDKEMTRSDLHHG